MIKELIKTHEKTTTDIIDYFSIKYDLLLDEKYDLSINGSSVTMYRFGTYSFSFLEIKVILLKSLSFTEVFK